MTIRRIGLSGYGAASAASGTATSVRPARKVVTVLRQPAMVVSYLFKSVMLETMIARQKTQGQYRFRKTMIPLRY
ncbi:exported hypothetical protein [Cupriavidus taiwanensis]|nr:exported hypothetical protein [Cupriavidus taiwanensis]